MAVDTAGAGALIGLDRQALNACVHCGFCLPSCPTYQVLGVEMDSPRGRVMQIGAVDLGDVPVQDAEFRKHMYLCLNCRACETACPSGVRYGTLVEAARANIPPASAGERLLRQAILGGIFKHPARVRALGTGMRAYQRLGFGRLARRTGALRLLPERLRDLEALQPVAQGPILPRRLPALIPATGARRYRVGLITGCVMNEVFSGTNRSTAQVLARNGADVVVPREQACCGALHLHSGEKEMARSVARRMIDVFEPLHLDAVIINAAGCGSTLKEYGHLFEPDDPYAERARAFADKVRDVNEWLAEIPFAAPSGSIRARVTYQDACHLAHAQRIRLQPRRLIQSIPGVELVELPDSDTCCGSAGIYNITSPELSMQLLERRMDRLAETGATILAAANPGCMIQLAFGVRQRGYRVEVVHPIDLLDRAYRGEG
ncbi:MAG TPA: (Fe-S)-binding protein [Chloroflexota bacterium]|nr:(Fe-S)-binding protein [Chloroflexota bacterium]